MSNASFAWLLNLDAELELASGPSYSPKKSIEAAILAQRQKTGWLTGSDASVFPSELEITSLRQDALLPWCPTWRTRRLAQRAGKRHLSLTAPETMRLVSDKAFVVHSSASGPEERGLVASQNELLSSIESSRVRGKRLRVKRRFGAQGRGQRTLLDPLGEGDVKFLEDGFRNGGFLVEPELEAARELSLHGMLLGENVEFGTPCALAVDAFGSVASIVRHEESTRETERALVALAEPVVASLLREGYAGPFGIDFLETRDARYVSDINPRFTLGWSIGFGERRDLALAHFVESCERAPK